jgi:hypothetical protein
VEGIPAHLPVLNLHLVRPDHLPAQYRAHKPGRDCLDPGQHPVGLGLYLSVMRSVGVAVRHPLREQRHDMLADWRRESSHASGMQMSANGRSAGVPETAYKRLASLGVQ